MDFIVTSSTDKQEAFHDFLHHKIIDFNRENSAPHRAAHEPGGITPLHLIVSATDGTWLGGLTGDLCWDWLEIKYFYLPEELRKHGIGSLLLREVEQMAVDHGCKHAYLTTFEFQARAFYEQNGYAVVGKLDDYPPGSTYYFMAKQLK